MARETLSLSRAPSHSPKLETTRREHVDKVAKSLKAQRQDYESDWHSIADYSGYGDIPGLTTTAQGTKRPKMRQLMDSHPILSFRTVESGMYSGMSSPNRPWIEFAFADDELNDYQPAREYCDKFQRLIYAMFDASNFYQIARQNYGEMARFGPAAGIMTEHWREIAPCMAMPIGSYWFGMDDAYKVDTLLRAMPLTVDQVVKKFVGRPGNEYDWTTVDVNVRNAWDNSDYGKIINCWQLIEPGVGGRFDSTIWDQNDDRKDKVLEAKGFAEQPFWAPRWSPTGLYGRGVGQDAMADMRELHMQAKRKRELTDLLAKPPTAGPAKDLDMRPGAHTYVADLSTVAPAKPVYQVDPRAINEVRADIVEIKQSIDRLTYADLFMAITNMPGVQPRNVEELLKRDEEKLTQIGPVVEMVNDDMLPIAVERMIGIAHRGGMLDDLNPPEELQGRELKLKFVSVLAQAQKMLGLSTTERVVGFVGSLGSVFGPQVLDKIDPDEIIDDYAERANLPSKAIRDKQTVEEIRKGREQQQQMEQIAAMAAPAKDATQAAANIAEMSNESAQF